MEGQWCFTSRCAAAAGKGGGVCLSALDCRARTQYGDLHPSWRRSGRPFGCGIYSIRTEESYLFWVRRLILFHGKRHPRELGELQVGAFLTHLAVDRKVSASTQNQALNALVFLYKAVLERPLGDVGGVVRVRRPQRLPVVLPVSRSKRCLRVKDLDFEHRAIMVRDGKGQKDRVVTLAG